MCHLIGSSIVIEVWNRCEESTAEYRNMVARWTLARTSFSKWQKGTTRDSAERGIEVNQILFPDSIDDSKCVTLG